MTPGKTVAFYTLGCKLNFAESSTIARSFEDQGYARIHHKENPDVLVINTCTVTDNADKKCRHIIRQAKRNNPNTFVAIIGCYAQLKPQEIADIEGVNLVLGANEKFDLPNYIMDVERINESKIHASDIKSVRTFEPSYSSGDRIRTFLKVQDGCDYFCSFCTIPHARGRSRSAPIDQTLKSAKEAIQKGCKEIVLTGVNIGDFGRFNGENFLQLIQELDVLDGVERFRISSIEPNLLSKDIIEFVASSRKFMPHFHIPLQSGSDAILKSMRRRYDTALYKERISLIRQLIPHASIGVDVIVGSPGETKEHFEETVSFLNQLDISYLHVFTYSERANTTALRNPEVVDMEERRERSKQLRILSLKKQRSFYEQHVHSNASVLFEGKQEGNEMFGYTENYIKVSAPFQNEWINTIQQLELTKINSEGLMETNAGLPVYA